METKKHIRERILAIRDAMVTEERMTADTAILHKILQNQYYKRANCLFTYLSYHSEVDTMHLVLQAWKDGKAVYCPKVSGDTMRFYRIYSFTEVEEGYRGILEPKTQQAEEVNLSDALCIMPGVAFDRYRHRIGYGKGFYDKFLSDKPELMTMALCYTCQMVEDIQIESFDCIPKILYTETKQW
ncbi:MAG: 5-formyltetrahydrofolate cyclo-ligase [Lachnospiraceae bacterium]